MIVVDTNIIAYCYLPGSHTAAAEDLMLCDADWAAALLWRSEFRNVLGGYLRRGSITFAEAVRIQSEAEALLAGAEFEVDSMRVLQLAEDSDCSAYDCEFVAVAIALGTRLVTMDRKVLAAFPSHTRPLV